MKRWLKIGAALMLVAWMPFIYAELTSEPAEKKARELPDEELAEPEVATGSEVATGKEGEPPPAEAPPPSAEEPAAEPKPAPAEPPAAEEPPTAPIPTAVEPPAAEPEPTPPEGEPTPAEEEAEEEPAPPPVASGPSDVLKHAFETQPRDALWATDTEARIAAVFHGEDVPAGMLEKASCRRAVCKLDVRWKRDHAAQYVSVYQSLREQFGGEVAVEPVGEPDEGGQQVVHLYLPRKGYTASDLSR